MFVIQPRTRYGRDEELTTVRGRTRIGHGESIWSIKSGFCRKLIFEITTPYRFSSCTVAYTELSAGVLALAALEARLTERITRLQHEFRDDTMKNDTVIIPRSGMLSEILNGLRGNIREQLETLQMSAQKYPVTGRKGMD